MLFWQKICGTDSKGNLGFKGLKCRRTLIIFLNQKKSVPLMVYDRRESISGFLVPQLVTFFSMQYLGSVSPQLKNTTIIIFQYRYRWQGWQRMNGAWDMHP